MKHNRALDVIEGQIVSVSNARQRDQRRDVVLHSGRKRRSVAPVVDQP